MNFSDSTPATQQSFYVIQWMVDRDLLTDILDPTNVAIMMDCTLL